MRTVQMTLDDSLVKRVDKMAKSMKTTRSGFTRMALQAALKDQKMRQLVEQHRKGYEKFPVEPGEFDVWEDEQAWGDE